MNTNLPHPSPLILLMLLHNSVGFFFLCLFSLVDKEMQRGMKCFEEKGKSSFTSSRWESQPGSLSLRGCTNKSMPTWREKTMWACIQCYWPDSPLHPSAPHPLITSVLRNLGYKKWAYFQFLYYHLIFCEHTSYFSLSHGCSPLPSSWSPKRLTLSGIFRTSNLVFNLHHQLECSMAKTTWSYTVTELLLSSQSWSQGAWLKVSTKLSGTHFLLEICISPGCHSEKCWS